ncbi:LADA_0D09692g1_1 [Lachancea dasiensis]|uniref:LADA_0D09692g1_1 n=1 Tax=Lachancea dasiensis TaxID=1072105 RepID=A0A1G4J7E4_9SACH|nr:LADA_0D09692g1_1 [Lachancea dasiensis]
MTDRNPILDDLVDSGNEESSLKTAASDDDESLLQLDGDAFRLDNGTQSQSSNNKRTLFVNGDSTIESPARDVGGLLRTPLPHGNTPRKLNDTSTGSEPVDLWDFKPLTHRAFEARVPNHRKIKGWRGPSRKLISNLANILENNVGIALEQSFTKYQAECERFVLDQSIRTLRKSKERMLFHLVGKLEHCLRQSRFPMRTSDKDLDIEYMCAKRKFLQDRLSHELRRLQTIEHQVEREKSTLNDLKESHSRQMDRTARKSKSLTEQLSQNLHPALSKAMINSFGLIRDTEANPDRYHHDVDNLNLKLQDPLSDGEHVKLRNHIPSLQSFEDTVQDIQKSCHFILEESPS